MPGVLPPRFGILLRDPTGTALAHIKAILWKPFAGTT